jgi:hypothetical protein
MVMKYSRLYTDSAGESHFEDIEMELAPANYAPPAPPLNLSPFIPATKFALMSAPAGWRGDWHPATARSVYFLLAGEWEVTSSDGEVRRFSPGSVLLAEDTTGKGHASRVSSDCDSLTAVVRLED